MEIFGQAQIVIVARSGFAGYFADLIEQDVGACLSGVRGRMAVRSLLALGRLADPLGALTAQELSGRGVGELWFWPFEDAANLLVIGQSAIRSDDGFVQLRIAA